MAATIASLFRRGKATVQTTMVKVDGKSGAFSTAGENELFTKVDPAIDGADCFEDCSTCTIKYPAKFPVNEEDALYGHIKGFATHLLVATGKTDWVRDVEDEKGSVMEAVGKANTPANGRLKLSASNIPTPSGEANYDEPTTCLLLPAFTIIENVTPANVPDLITSVIDISPTTTTPLAGAEGESDLANWTQLNQLKLPSGLSTRPCPHDAVILLCSQKTRDARCGQSAPLLKREFERHLRVMGLHRDYDDERRHGVGVYFISHIGGHKYSANVMVYRRAGFGQTSSGESSSRGVSQSSQSNGGEIFAESAGGSQCIWLARVRPEDCEGIIKFTVLQGKVIKPERQLRGGFDREKGLCSW